MLYHMLLSSGCFPVYRTEPCVFDLLVPRFGDFCSVATRRQLMRCWLRTRQFRRSGLDAGEITEKVVASVTTGGEFLCAVMGEKPECFLVFLNHAAALPSASASLLRRHYLADVSLAFLDLFKHRGRRFFCEGTTYKRKPGRVGRPRSYRLRSRSRPSPAHRYPLFSVHSSTSAQTPLLEQVRWSDAHLLTIVKDGNAKRNEGERIDIEKLAAEVDPLRRVAYIARQFFDCQLLFAAVHNDDFGSSDMSMQVRQEPTELRAFRYDTVAAPIDGLLFNVDRDLQCHGIPNARTSCGGVQGRRA